MTDPIASTPPASPPPAAASGTRGKPPKPPKAPKAPKPPRRGRALAVVALIIALVALGAVAFGAWQWWQWRGDRAADAQAAATMHHRIGALQANMTALQHAQTSAAQTRQHMHVANQALNQRVEGIGTRIDSLDAAVAALARNQQHGRSAALLDQTALLLRIGDARYTLFHDAGGALNAYTLASRALAAVNNPAYAGVRHTLASERKALAALHPAARTQDLAALAKLRSTIGALPLKPLNAGSGKNGPHGFASRLWHALSTAVVVRRVGSSPQTLADTRLTRHLAALDVAQAEAARLAWNDKAFHAALKRVAQALATAFDSHDAGVQRARASVARMRAEATRAAAPVKLGRALQQLRAVRAVRDIGSQVPAVDSGTQPAPSAPVPAVAGSAA